RAVYRRGRQPGSFPSRCPPPIMGAGLREHRWRQSMNLHEAAGNGNVAAVRKLLAAGNSPDGRDELGNTPLMLAALGASLEAFQALCEAGADLNAKNAN